MIRIIYNNDNEVWIKEIIRLIDEYVSYDANNSSSYMKKRYDYIEKYLNQVLPRLTGKNIKISFITSDKPFIMSVYPDISELEDQIKNLCPILIKKTEPTDINKYIENWSSINTWYLEIDDKILNKNSKYCVKSGEEFVALLCHEIGHVFDASPISTYLTFKKTACAYSMIEKMAFSNINLIKRIILPMFVNGLSFKIILHGVRSIRDEIRADSYVPEIYRQDLINYMERCILNNPSCYTKIIVSNEENNDIQEDGVEFSRQSIDFLKFRKQILLKKIAAQYKNTKSPYYKSLMVHMSKNISGLDLSEVNEQTNIFGDIDLVRIKPVLETLVNNEFNSIQNEYNYIIESTRITQKELDILKIKLSNIETIEDKLNLLYRVYDYIEILEKQQMKSNTINNKLLSDMYNLKNEIISKPIADSSKQRWGLYVKYPSGYENTNDESIK